MAHGDADRSFARPTASAALALVVVSLPAFLLGAFAPAIKEDLNFGDTELGALFTLGYLVSAIVLQASGRSADHNGARTLMRAGLVVAAVGSLTLGAVGRTYLVIAVAYSVTRVAEALVQPATNTLIAGAVPPHQRGRATGTKQAAIPLATTLAGLSVPVLGDSIGWEGAFIIVAAMAVPAWIVVPNVPAAGHGRAQSTRQLWRTPHLRAIALGGAFAAASVVTVAGFLTTAAEEAGFSKGAAGLLLTLGGMVMIASRLAWGWLADRLAFNRFTAVGAAVGVGASAHLMFATEGKTLMAVGTVVVFGIGWSWPGLVLLGVMEQHPNEPGAATAVLQTSIRLGALGSPLLFGAVADRYGFDVAWLLPFAFAITSSLLMFLAGHMTGPGSADPLERDP